MSQAVGDVTVEVGPDFVAEVEIRRPPNNFFDTALIRTLADVYESLAEGAACRAIVLCSEGKHFCAGANFHTGGESTSSPVDGASDLYREALRMVSAELPVVAAVQGAAIGGGLGLACAADFRVATPAARFAANFSRLGFHQGFGLSVTLPNIVGFQAALEMLYTGRRVSGDEAFAKGLCDRLVSLEDVRSSARDLAAQIAGSAPLAVRSIRRTMRRQLVEDFGRITDHERAEQMRLRSTEDFAEGTTADLERRTPVFRGR